MKITESFLDAEDACRGSYSWLKKQKDKSAKAIVEKLYKEERYQWCFWLIYRLVPQAKILVWGIIFMSFLLSGLSFILTLSYEGNVAFAAASFVAAFAAAAFAATFVAASFAAFAAASFAATNFFLSFLCKLLKGRVK